MKKLWIFLFLIGISLGSFAQRGHLVHTFAYHPRVIVGLGAYSPFYPYYGLGYYPFYPYPGYGYYRPSKLQMKIEDIKLDYQDKIRSAKADQTLSHSEKKETVRKLKQERNQAIEDLKKNYYKY